MANASQAVCCLGEYRRRVLLAHSLAATLQELGDAFVRAGFDVVLATDVSAALQYLDRYSFDVCIVEYSLVESTETGGAPRPSGAKVVRRFEEVSHDNYESAWVLIAKAEEEVRAFEAVYWRARSRRDLPIVNIAGPHVAHAVTPLDAPATYLSSWDAVARDLLDFVAERVNFFWNLPVALEGAIDDIHGTLESITKIADEPRLYGDPLPSAREILGEALRIAIQKKPATPGVTARARLLADQGYAGTVVALSLREPGAAERLVKVSGRDAGAREVANFQKYIQARNFSFCMQLLHNARTIRGDLCVIVYNFLAGFVRLTTHLRDYRWVDANASLIKQLFEELHRAWYSHGTWSPQRPADLLRMWGIRSDHPLSDKLSARRAWEASFKKQRGTLTFVWVADGGQRSVNCETIPRLLDRIPESKAACGDWLATTHGDLHSMNVLVSPKGEMLSLADFSEVREEGSVLQDAAQFEAHLLIDLIGPGNGDNADETDLLDRLYGTLPLMELSDDAMRGPALHAVYTYVREVRRAIAKLTAALTHPTAEELRFSYCLALLVAFVRRWQYLKNPQYTDQTRWRTLYCSNRIADSLLKAIG